MLRVFTLGLAFALAAIPVQGQAQDPLPPEIIHGREMENDSVLQLINKARRDTMKLFERVQRAYTSAGTMPDLIQMIPSYCRSGGSLLNCFVTQDAAHCLQCIEIVEVMADLRGRGTPPGNIVEEIKRTFLRRH
jgi:hypothetical protein